MVAVTNPGDAEAFNAAVDVAHDLVLLGLLQERLATFGVRAELREHLVSLVIFRASPGLPVCVFVSGGRFYCWDSGRRREHVAHVNNVAGELAELADGRGRERTASVPCRSREGTYHENA
jgi:hypothetical protein